MSVVAALEGLAAAGGDPALPDVAAAVHAYRTRIATLDAGMAAGTASPLGA